MSSNFLKKIFSSIYDFLSYFIEKFLDFCSII